MGKNTPDILGLLSKQVVIFDGAMGTSIQSMRLSADDFGGKEGCNEYLAETRPDAVKEIHDSFFSVGCNVVETNTFGANRVVLSEYGLEDQAYTLNRRSAELAREVALGYDSPDFPRYVAGSIGPTTKLPTLGHIGFDDLVLAYREQVSGLMDGGVDLLTVETCQDLLQIRAAVFAIRREFERTGRRLPIMVTLTIERNGAMLLGSELGAALASLGSLRPDILGLNCATGPTEMKRHVQFLSKYSHFPIAVQPNAGLPENKDGETIYPLSPAEFADWHKSFVLEDGIQVAGGCCGTTPEHLRRLVEDVSRLKPVSRFTAWEPSLASLYYSVPLNQEPPPFIIGERTNANGSRKFRELLMADDFDGIVSLARDQERVGAHALDVCAAHVGRDEIKDISEIVSRFVRQIRLPLFIDTTQPRVMEAALRLYGGRCVLNSVNLEDGEEKARDILALARDFGVGVVALAIDEKGMAKTVERKIQVAERIYSLATGEFGLSPSDLIFDVLTFAIGSGDESLRDAAVNTIDAVRELKKRLPGVFTVLGISNISFGLQAEARSILNSAFLQLAVEAGLDLAIIDPNKLIPLSRIDPAAMALAENLLNNRPSKEAGDPLFAFIRYFDENAGVASMENDDGGIPSLVDLIRKKIVEGDRNDLESLLSAALIRSKPLEIINTVLLPAMKEVGKLFGAGKMQLPFVLQSAEVMKHAVDFLEPAMEKSETVSRGRLVLATVKGDVHDIGKNMVDILLSNNGFDVVNLGTKVPIEDMIRVCREKSADAIGMSGLLVKSTVVMKENLEEMKRRGADYPVILGGAALYRGFVEDDLRAIYGENVHYGADAFDGLRIMERLISENRGSGHEDSETEKVSGNILKDSGWSLEDALGYNHSPSGIEKTIIPEAPFFGTRMRSFSALEIFDSLNEERLFQNRWQYQRGSTEDKEYRRMIEDNIRPAFERLKRETIENGILVPKGIYGYLPCYSNGNELIVLDENGSEEKAVFRFPRQRKSPFHSIADYFRTKDRGPDVFGFFIVTVGSKVAQSISDLFESHRYKDYLQLHGLAVESAEAAAGLLHSLMRKEMGFDDKSCDEGEKTTNKPSYRGRRFSFGYPPCPDLEDQRVFFELLRPERIDVTLTESAQMVPEHTVSAFVVHHPSARYFNPLAVRGM